MYSYMKSGGFKVFNEKSVTDMVRGISFISILNEKRLAVYG